MPKTTHKGRNNNEPYVMLHRGVTNSDAWKSLDGITRAGLIEIWTYHNGSNNGQISFSVRQMRSALKVSTGKAAKIFSDLQDRGFLVKRRGSSFDWKEGAGKAQARQEKAHLRDRPDRLRLFLARHRVVGFATCRADKTRIVFEIGPDRTHGVFIPSGSGDIGHPAVGCAGAVIAVGHPHLFEGGQWWRGAA